MSPTKAEQNQIKSIIGSSYNRLYSQFTSDELLEVGNYKILKQIGEGSFGKVYLASHKPTHRKVVLKTSDKSDPNLVREVFYHRQFDFPYITKLYEVIVTETKVWMALEYCPGRELYEHLLMLHRIPLDECAKLFAQIVSAVHYAHSLNCVHRDLKLENILLDKKGNAKLTDFGFTRECVSKSSLETICGTTVYMAPELTQRQAYDGFKIDIWSLGIILYTMINGTMPFDEEDETRTKWKIVNDFPSFDDNFMSHDAKDLIKKLLAKCPTERPTMEQILLHPFLQPYGQIMLSRTEKIIKRQRSGITQFRSRSERKLLKRLKQSGFDTQLIKASIQKRKCDSLSGLWLLLLEHERACEKVDYPRRSRSVLSVKKVFDPQSSNQEIPESQQPIRKHNSGSATEVKKGSSLKKILSKNSDGHDFPRSSFERRFQQKPQSLQQRARNQSSPEPRKKYTEPSFSTVSKQPSPQQHPQQSSVHLVDTKTNDSATSVSSYKGAGSNDHPSGGKKNNIFTRVTKFFKSKKQQYNSSANNNGVNGNNGMENNDGSLQNSNSRKSRSTPTVGSTNANDYTDSQDKKRSNRSESLNSVTKGSNQSTAKDQDTAASQLNDVSAGDAGIETKIQPDQRLLKRLKSTTSSDISGQTSAGNYDVETVSNQNIQAASHDGHRSPNFLRPRPVSGISEFSNDTFNSEYSTDGNTSSLRISDFPRPNFPHASTGDISSELKGRSIYKHALDRRDLSIMSSASSASEKSSRTDSFYDITTASPPMIMDIRKTKGTAVADSVLPRFGAQHTWFPRQNRSGSRRGSIGRKNHNRGFTKHTSQTQSIIQEESSLNSQEEKHPSNSMALSSRQSLVMEEDNDFFNQGDERSVPRRVVSVSQSLTRYHPFEDSTPSLGGRVSTGEVRSCSPKFPISSGMSAPSLVTEDDEALRIADQEDNYSD
ncbi:hypothetical protein ZYGR_0AS03050 [Zygosaccharomyces rouxii]|uniref:non-specific serine/threonine protein kinase n=1 Tax=Zygosaccharomyces rouxii TaxID=4956 RepID=A0A1Q3AH50_ZYGRO|nr:hypothetical protein ZYGR_0AS03050 [Zygosaccharomyces rouxii]